MKKHIRLLVLALAFATVGCISIPPGLLQYAQEQFAEQNQNISPSDVAKAMEILLKIQTEVPAAFQDTGAIAQLITILEGYESMVETNAYQAPEGALFAGFLLDGTKMRVMNKLSINANKDDYLVLLEKLKGWGFNQIPFFLANEGDGGPVPTTFYRDAWFGDVDPVKVELMRSRIMAAKEMGFAVELWGFADDSPSLAKATPEQLRRFYEDCVKYFGDLADSWCLGLEIDEWGKHWWNALWHTPDVLTIRGCADILEATGKPVAIHLTTYKHIDLAHKAGVKRLNAQFGWLKSAGEMTSAMKWLDANRGDIEIVATEFNKDSITPLATALATEAMKQGAIGTQTGRPAK